MRKLSFHFVAIALPLLFCFCESRVTAESPAEFLVMVYYSVNETAIYDYDVSGLTHIIFSFCRLDGNTMVLRENRIATVEKLVSLKEDNPGLKVLLALGGWGGCETCSEVFSSPKGRSEFALSVKEFLELYGAEGIDLDWEYPAISGYPGHPFMPEDRQNFTMLVKTLRAITYRDLPGWIGENEMTELWDSITGVPYAFSAEKGLFITYDDSRSVANKTRYARENGLAGIMFWQLGGDKPEGGLREGDIQRT